MIELIYLFSAFQCGSNAPQAVLPVAINDATLYVNEKVVTDKDVKLEDIGVIYEKNASCAMKPPTGVTLKTGDTIPNLVGAYNQTGLDILAASINKYSYLELFLIELGTTNTQSSIYDLQDVVVLKNKNTKKECVFDATTFNIECSDKKVYPAD